MTGEGLSTEATSEGVKLTLSLSPSEGEPALAPLRFANSVVTEGSQCKTHVSGLNLVETEEKRRSACVLVSPMNSAICSGGLFASTVHHNHDVCGLDRSKTKRIY